MDYSAVQAANGIKVVLEVKAFCKSSQRCPLGTRSEQSLEMLTIVIGANPEPT